MLPDSFGESNSTTTDTVTDIWRVQLSDNWEQRIWISDRRDSTPFVFQTFDSPNLSTPVLSDRLQVVQYTADRAERGWESQMFVGRVGCFPFYHWYLFFDWECAKFWRPELPDYERTGGWEIILCHVQLHVQHIRHGSQPPKMLFYWDSFKIIEICALHSS